ncbi:DUF418 domain-containing protein [Tsuneonella sp. HG222]
MDEAADTEPSPGAMATPDLPVRSAERIVTLDLIRGVAVLGILFANITAFGQSTTAYYWPPAIEGGATAADKAIWLFQLIFVDHKFRGLFSLLFGAGVYLFMERAWARGRGRGLQLRRLAWLFAFGVVHYFLIWTGDILAAYAVTGMWALLFVRKSADSQLKWGVGLYIAGLFLMSFGMGAKYAAAESPAIMAQMPADQRAEFEDFDRKAMERSERKTGIYQTGTYPEIVAHHVTKEGGQFINEVMIVPLVETLGLMLIGMALYRRGFFSGGFDAAAMRRWGWIGLIGGLALTVPFAVWPYLAGFPYLATAASFNAFARIGQLPMVLGIAALLAVNTPKIAETALGRRLIAAGRMAFSNYLGTSFVLMFVFHGWALGLMGRLHRPELLAIVLLVWAVMLLWSPAWLARYRYGPLEWLWRCLTYRKLFPNRR